MPNKTIHKIATSLCWLLVGSMLFSVCGCHSKNNEEGSYYESEIALTTNAANSEKNNTGDLNNGNTTGTSGKDAYANVDVNGYTFTMCGTLLKSEYTSDCTLFEKTLFDKIDEVEKAYGCKIKIINNLETSVDNLAPLIASGKKVADVLEMDLTKTLPLAAAGYIVPWDGKDGIDVNASKWTASYTTMATWAGKHYGLQFMKPAEVRYCAIMNKTALSKAGIDADGIYNLINQNQWNWDTFRSYCNTVVSKNQSNGNTSVYGFGGNAQYISRMLLASNNATLATMDSKGNASATYTSNAAIDSINFFNQLVNEDKVYDLKSGMTDPNTYYSSQPKWYDEFINGKIAFLLEDSWVLNQQIKPRVKNFDYGMITIPMGPNASSYAASAEHARVFSITANNKGDDLKKTLKIFNALSEPVKGNEDEDWWVDDVQADYFQNNDTQSINIYKKLLNESTFDIGAGITSLSNTYDKEVVLNSVMYKKTTPSAATQGMADQSNTIATFFKNFK